MPSKHQCSPCCRARIYRFGGRRRQCARCKRTWRTHPHKRGRKPQRVRKQLAERIISDGQRSRDQQRWYPTVTLRRVQQRVHRRITLSATAPRACAHLRGRYILLGDGLWYRFDGTDYVLYLFLLKPRRRNIATILDPVLLPGREQRTNWEAALDTIPAAIRARVCAFVSDHFRAAEAVVDARGWLHQLCQFHLLKELQKRRGKRKRQLPGAPVREAVYQSILHLLHVDDAAATERLHTLVDRADCPKKIRMIGREFLRSQERYRTYQRHHALTIPNTTSAVESLGKCIRKRTRSLRTPDAVLLWATAYVRAKQTMTCRGSTPLQSSTKLIS